MLYVYMIQYVIYQPFADTNDTGKAFVIVSCIIAADKTPPQDKRGR